MTPELRVIANGRDITEIVRDRFVRAEVIDVVDEEADSFELELDDRPPGIVVPPTGAELSVELGFAGQGTAPMGSYVVSEIGQQGPPATLTIRAQSADLLGELKAPRTRSWSDYTIGDVVGTIAGRHGLEPRVDPELRGLALPHIDQIDESDISLLRRLASYQLDVVAKVAAGRLVFLRRQVLANELARAATRIERADAVEYRVLRADRAMYAAVAARWREFDVGELEEEVAGDADGGPTFALPETYPDQTSARNAAETRLRALERGTRTGSLTLSPGRPGLAADAPVELAGWGAGVDAVWVATQVRHALTGAGYQTHLDIEAVTEPWERAEAERRPEAPFGAPAAASRQPPKLRHVVERVAAEHPAALRDAQDTPAFVDLAVPALRAADGGRWGHRRESGGPVSTGSVAYYTAAGAPAEGSTDIAVIDIVQGREPALPAWTRAAASGSWTA